MLRFRKYPWPNWFCGFVFLAGSIAVLILAEEKILTFQSSGAELGLLAFMIISGLIFLWYGRTKSTVFDRKEKAITIRKRNIFCHRRTITKYDLGDLTDVRAVYRGINSGQVRTLHYAIILEFDNIK